MTLLGPLPSCNDTKERLSLAYLRVVAARCRSYVVAEEGGDYSSCDATVISVVHPRRVVFVQLKSTSSPLQIVGSDVVFDLPVGNYDDLRRVDGIVPHILVVLELHAAVDKWLTVRKERMVLRNAAWWTDLRGMPPTKNTRWVRVHIPVGRVFTPKALTGIYAAMAQLAPGERRKPLYDY